MSILDEEYLTDDKTLEFYNTILYEFEKYCKYSAINKKLFHDNKNLLIKYLPDIITIYDDGIVINNTSPYIKNTTIYLDLYEFIPRLILFNNSYIPLLDEKEIEYIDKVDIYNRDNLYKVIRKHNNKYNLQVLADNNELREFHPNIIINNINHLTFPDIDAINFIGDDQNKLFIKNINKLSINLVNPVLYTDSKNSINNLCDKYNDLFKYSKIEVLRINLNELYWGVGKEMYIFDNGLDEYSFNMFSNFNHLNAKIIEIHISNSFLHNETSIDNMDQLNNYISYMFYSIMRKNNIFNRIRVEF